MTNSEQLLNPIYSIPDNMRVYAIGDLHGHLESLKAMHFKIDMHMADHPIEKTTIVYLGDYIDRGPESAQLIERLYHLQQEDSPIDRYFIKGNHEWAMLGFMDAPLLFGPDYLKFGGLETLRSYGVDIPGHITKDTISQRAILPAEFERLAVVFNEKVPAHHVEFLNTLDLHVCIGGYLFVHAGIKPEVSLKDQDVQDLMRIRGAFSNYEKPHEYRVVHGHQISDGVDIQPNRIGVDTGFYESGVLSCVALEKDLVEVLQIKQEL